VQKRTSKWHAVTVVLNDSSCAAAALCRQRRFLSGEAPRLPLSECDHPQSCQCKYRHYDDRRAGVRRSADLGGALPSDPVKQNRRENRGRRDKDKR
jgi:hypothetical protein